MLWMMRMSPMVMLVRVRRVGCSEVDFVSDEDDGNIDSQGTDIWEPVGRYSVKGVGVVNGIYYA